MLIQPHTLPRAGRIDDMLNVSGHLVSTSEVESTLLRHAAVSEAAAVSQLHEIKGECLHCFVVLKADSGRSRFHHHHHHGAAALPIPVAKCQSPSADEIDVELRTELCQLVRQHIGPFVVPDHIEVGPLGHWGEVYDPLFSALSPCQCR